MINIIIAMMLVVYHLDRRHAWLIPTHQNSKLLLKRQYTT